MRAFIAGVSIAITALVLPAQPVVAAPALSLTIIGGGGVLTDGRNVAVNAMSLTLATPRRNVERNNGSLVVDGVRTKCTIAAVTGCTQATLDCEDSSTHEVTAGEPGGAPGSIDGVDLADGFINMRCIGR